MALRFGLFGTGYWAQETQAAALAAHPDAAFVGIWGRDPEKAGRLAHRYGVVAYVDADALIADVDAVAVALPPDVQTDIAVRAATAGRHLLLDKPLALTVADADRIVTLVAENRLASVVFFTNRFYGNVSAFLDETITTGGWYGARSTSFASIFQPGNPYAASAWRREKGGLWDIGPHALSVLLPVLGPVAEVTAIDGPHETTHLLLRHASGAVSSLALTLDAPRAANAFEFVFYGEHGWATVPGGDGAPVEAFGQAITELAEAASSPEPSHPCDVRFGREVVAILATAAAARDAGHMISL